MGWENNSVFNIVIVTGTGSGVFTYDASGNLRSANVGQTTTDPLQGHTAYAGFSTFNGHGAVISLFSSTLDAQLWYADTGSGSQGSLTSSIASTSGTDPFGNAYVNGIGSYVPGADTAELVNSSLLMSSVTDFAAAQITGSTGILTLESGQTTNIDGVGELRIFSSIASGVSRTLLAAEVQQAIFGAGSVPDTSAVVEVRGPISPASPIETIVPRANTDLVLGTLLAADTNNEWQMSGQGVMQWGSGAASPDCGIDRQAANLMRVTTADWAVTALGRGLRVREGANCKQGTATLTAGTVVVANTSVTANSRIFLTAQDNNSTGALRVSARTAGTSFTITSSNAADTGVVAFEMFEPG